MRVVVTGAAGNVGTSPVAVPVPASVLRLAADLSWRAHVQPTPAGWLDLAVQAPILDTTRARNELGWAPTYTSGHALTELLQGFADRACGPTPPLARTGWRAPAVTPVTPQIPSNR